MSRILFAPELIAPPPIVWLPNDNAGVARAEAQDLEHYHGLKTVIDVRSKDDVIRMRRPPPQLIVRTKEKGKNVELFFYEETGRTR
jgi:hypothetical protein